MRKLALALVLSLPALLLIPSVASGQLAVADQLERVASIHVEPEFSFGDDDDELCEPSSRTLRAEAELVFRRSGISVSEETYGIADILRAGEASGITDAQAQSEFAEKAYANMPHLFTLGMTGVYLTGRCAIAYDLELSRNEILPHPDKLFQLALLLSFHYGGVWTGPPSNATQQMQEVTRNGATLLANEILKAKQ